MSTTLPLTGTTHDSRRGILWMVGGMTAFLGNDAIVKHVSEHLPTPQIITVRGLMAITLIALVAWRMGVLHRVGESVRGWVGIRAGAEGGGTLLYLSALSGLPLANATAIMQVGPLIVALLAYLLLRERISRVRWLAIATGFAGVLLVIQPNPRDFDAFAWLALLAAFVYSVRDVVTRYIPPGIPSILITLATAVVVTLIGVVLLSFTGWTPMRGADLAALAAAAVLLATAYYAMIAAVRHGELSVIAPFRYTGLLWAVILGSLVWGDIPNAPAWAGIALLTGAGLTLIREQRRPLRRSGPAG